MTNPPIRWITVGTCIIREPLFRRFRLGEFLEARIIPKRIEHWIEPEQRGSERHGCTQWAFIRYRKHFLQSSYSTVGFAHLRGYAGKSLNCTRAIDRVFLDRGHGHPLLDESERGGLVTETHIGQREITNKTKFSGCSLRKGSNSLRACRQLSRAAA